MIRTIDIAWAAGFLEGEGCFRWSHGAVRVSAIQVQREPLERLRRLVGGRIQDVPKPKLSARWGWKRQPYATWYVGCVASVGLMLTLFSLLSPRRKEQVATTLGRWQKRRYRTGPWKTHCKHGHLWIPANLYHWAYGKRCKLCWYETQAARTVYHRHWRDSHRESVRAAERRYREKTRHAS